MEILGRKGTRPDDRDAQDEIAIWRAEREISRIILRYAQGVDRQDFERLRACFHADAHVRYDEWFEGDVDEAIDWIEGSLPKLLGTLHVFGPPWIKLDLAADRATCETYAVNSARYPENSDGVVIQNVTGTRYFDAFERRDGVWGIVARRSVRAWTIDQPISEDPPLPQREEDPNGKSH